MSWNFFKDAGERLLKTFLQTFLAQITASGLGLLELVEDTSSVERAAIAGVAAVYSLIFSWASIYANSSPDASPASLVDTR